MKAGRVSARINLKFGIPRLLRDFKKFQGYICSNCRDWSTYILFYFTGYDDFFNNIVQKFYFENIKKVVK